MIIERIAGWTDQALALVGIVRDAGGRFRRALEKVGEDRRLEQLLARSTIEQLHTFAASGTRVVGTIGSPGWQDVMNAHDEADKLLLENFVDENMDSWEKFQRNVGAVRQHRARMRSAYDQVRLGILAEDELKRRRQTEPDRKTET